MEHPHHSHVRLLLGALCFICLLLATGESRALVDMRNANYAHTWMDIGPIDKRGDLYAPDSVPLLWLGVVRSYNSRSLMSGHFGFGWCSEFETKLGFTATGTIKLIECGGGLEKEFIPISQRRGEKHSIIHNIVAGVQAHALPYRAIEQVVGGFDPSLVKSMEELLLNDSDEADVLAKSINLLPRFPEVGEYRLHGTGLNKIRVQTHTITEYGESPSRSRTFDRQGRLIEIKEGRRSISITYKDDLPVKIQDNQVNWLDIEFGSDRLVKRIQRFPGGYESIYEHDANGNLRHVNNAWKKDYTYEYDELHNIVRATWPDKTFVRIDYDTEKDLVIGFHDRDGCLEDYSYLFDTDNHYRSLVAQKCPKTAAISNSYEFWHKLNAQGVTVPERIKVMGPAGLRELRYDDNGTLTDILTDAWAAHYEYFPNGLLKSRTSGGKRWTFSYAEDGKLNRIIESERNADNKTTAEKVLTQDPWPTTYSPTKMDVKRNVADITFVPESDERPSQFTALRRAGEYELAVDLLQTWDKEVQQRQDATLYRNMVAQSAMVLATGLADTPRASLSLQLTNLVLRIARAVPSVAVAPPVLLAARIQRRTGQSRQSIETISSGLSILAERPGDRPIDRADRVQLLRLQAKVYLELDNPAKSLAALESARAVDPNPESGDIAIAEIFANGGLYREARQMYSVNKLVFWAALGLDYPMQDAGKEGVDQIYSNLQQFALDIGQTQNALVINDARITRVKKSSSNTYALAVLLSERGTILVAADRYDDALRVSDEALGLVNHGAAPNPKLLARVLAERALIEDRLGDPTEASRLNARAIALDSSGQARVSNQAAFLSDLGRFGEAELLYRQARKTMLERLPADHPMLADLAWSQAQTQAKQGEFAAALESLDPAIAVMRKTYGFGHWRTARALNTRTEVLLSMAKFSEAYAAALLGLQSAGQSNSLEQRWRANHWMSKALAGIERREAAIFFGKRAVNDIQALRHTLVTLDRRVQAQYGETKNSVYEHLASLLIEDGRLPEAQQILTMFKENELHEFTQRAERSDPRTTRADLSRKQDAWSKELEAAFRDVGALGAELARLETLQRIGAIDAKALAHKEELQVKVDVAQTAFARVIERIGSEAKAATLEHESELQERLLRAKTGLRTLMGTLSSKGHSRTVCLQYLVTNAKLYILVTTPEVQFVRNVDVSSKRLHRAIDAFRTALLEPKKDPIPTAHALYELLIGPVRDELERTQADTLMLSLMGALRYVPFAALHDGKDYLVRRFPIAIVTDAAITQGLDAPKFAWNVTGLGVAAQVSKDFDPLPAVRDEMRYIVRSDTNRQGILPGRVYIDGEFTAARYRRTVDERPSVIHIASHFKFAANSDLRSFLLLGDGTRLSLHDMMRDSYRFKDLELLALSACETGLGGGTDSAGREVESLATLAQNQGASAVLATLWPVIDRSTGVLMERFYKTRQSKRGMSKAESLRQAQLQLLDGTGMRENAVAPYSHPYFWAPFVLYGNWL